MTHRRAKTNGEPSGGPFLFDKTVAHSAVVIDDTFVCHQQVRPLAPHTLNLCIPELVTVRLLDPHGEPYHRADLLLSVHAFARRRNDYSLGPFPTDSSGVARITKADLQAEVSSNLDADCMGHYDICDCHSSVEISLWTPDEILRIHDFRLSHWTSLLSGEQRRWSSMADMLALYSRALVATRSLSGLHAIAFRADWTDSSEKYSYDLRLQKAKVA
jgi:hypothetical protein